MTDDLAAWLHEAATPFDTLDPDAPEDAGLEALAAIVGDARVVMIGESAHRVHEFYDARHRMLRHLVHELGFTAFVMESGLPEGRLVDDWILGRSDARPRDVLNRGMTYHMGKCQEMLEQLAWMREHNAHAERPVRFYGMDIPASAATAKPAVEACIPVLERVDPGYATVVREQLLPLFDHLPGDTSGLAWAAPAIQSYLALDATTRFELTARINELAERMLARRVHYLEIADAAAAVEFAVRCVVTARHADAFLAAMIAGPTRRYPSANIRDLAMAENVRWILERETRIVVAAANGHVQRAPFHAPPFVNEPMTTMGEHLAAVLGNELVVIGGTYGGGEAWLHRPALDSLPGHSVPFVEDVGAPDPTSLDALLATAGMAAHLVDLRRVPSNGAIADRFAAARGTINGPHMQLLDPLVGFDAAYFVERISPWHTWIDAAGLTLSARK